MASIPLATGWGDAPDHVRPMLEGSGAIWAAFCVR